MALLGGIVAASSHVTTAGTRIAANTTPEPFTNWLLSLAEDAFVIGLSFITLKYPLVALAVTAAILVVMAMGVRSLWKWFTRRQGIPLSK
jgi:hypothetical protein